MIQNLDDAHEMVDRAISTAIAVSKPVYISVSCNLSSLPHPSFKVPPVPYILTQGPEPAGRYVLWTPNPHYQHSLLVEAWIVLVCLKFIEF